MTKEIQRLLKLSKEFIQVFKANFLTAYSILTLDFANTKDLINCVRWDTKGKRIVSASDDKKVKIVDFGSGKISYTGATSDSSK